VEFTPQPRCDLGEPPFAEPCPVRRVAAPSPRIGLSGPIAYMFRMDARATDMRNLLHAGQTIEGI
jgi:hypothetical protein